MFVIIAILVVGIIVFFQHPQFGKNPKGARLERVKNSSNYKDGKFQNLHLTSALTEGTNVFKSTIDFLFKKEPDIRPEKEIPSTKTDLHNLEINEDLLIWFGHSSYFIQIENKRILVDPVFSKAASPVSFYNQSFKGTNLYKPDDIPDIDYLFISHDHWDHLDYATVKALKYRISKVVCPLGVGEHFEHWGFKPEQIIEMDWYEEASNEGGFEIHCLPARHFSGRGLSGDKTLWASFLLKTPTYKIYIGGDSGYDTHFVEIGEKYGEIDLAILENGQYDKDWKYIHMMPEEVITASKDLNTKRMIPIHNSKYALGNHSWYEPLAEITRLYDKENFLLLTPMIGEPVMLKSNLYSFEKWWEQ